MKDNPIIFGTFQAELYRKGKLIDIIKGKNAPTVVGYNHLLDVTFGHATPVTQVATWYIGLIDNSPTPSLSENHTLASHSGWTEATGYTGNRQAWNDANAASKTKSSSSVSTFPITGTATIYGIFIASVASGTSGILWSEGAFSSTISVVNTDDLKVTYSLGF